MSIWKWWFIDSGKLANRQSFVNYDEALLYLEGYIEDYKASHPHEVGTLELGGFGFERLVYTYPPETGNRHVIVLVFTDVDLSQDDNFYAQPFSGELA